MDATSSLATVAALQATQNTISHLQQKIQSLTQTSSRKQGRHLFTAELMNEPIPEKMKIPHFEPYDGTRDPTDRLSHYENIMNLASFSDVAMCWAFQTKLMGDARTWCSGLETESISLWKDLNKEFTDYFLGKKACTQVPTHFFYCETKQGGVLEKLQILLQYGSIQSA